MKEPPPYKITSVDHALQLATILQFEGALTVAAAAERLGVARSTAHRILSMLTYRDFAFQDGARVYHAGRILEMTSHASSDLGRLRQASLKPLQQLVDAVDETGSVIVRAGASCRFLASIEGTKALRVSSREGMVFPSHQVTGGLIGLAALTDNQIKTLYAAERQDVLLDSPPDLTKLYEDIEAVRRTGVAINLERSERGLSAVGVPIRDLEGQIVGAVSLSMPSVRFERRKVNDLVSALEAASKDISQNL